MAIGEAGLGVDVGFGVALGLGVIYGDGVGLEEGDGLGFWEFSIAYNAAPITILLVLSISKPTRRPFSAIPSQYPLDGFGSFDSL